MILIFTETATGGKHLEFTCNKDKITKIMSEITLALKRLDDLSAKEKKEFLHSSPHLKCISDILPPYLPLHF